MHTATLICSQTPVCALRGGGGGVLGIAVEATLLPGCDLSGQEPGEGGGGHLRAAGGEAAAGEGAADGSAPAAEPGCGAGTGRAAGAAPAAPGHAGAAEQAGDGASARAAEVRVARVAHTCGWYPQSQRRNQGVVWGHGERRNQTPEALGCGQLGAFWNGDLLCRWTQGDLTGDVVSE